MLNINLSLLFTINLKIFSITLIHISSNNNLFSFDSVITNIKTASSLEIIDKRKRLIS